MAKRKNAKQTAETNRASVSIVDPPLGQQFKKKKRRSSSSHQAQRSDVIQLPPKPEAGSNPPRPKSKRSMSVEDILKDTFFYNDDHSNKPILTRRRFFFFIGIFLGIIITYVSIRPVVNLDNGYMNLLSEFVSNSLADLDFSTLLPANIVVEEFLSNVTSLLRPDITDNLFEPGRSLAIETGLSANYPVVLVPGIVSTVSVLVGVCVGVYGWKSSIYVLITRIIQGLESWSTANCSQKYFRKRMWGTLSE
jgi:phospholipid:diacylglycerol acyltransferase